MSTKAPVFEKIYRDYLKQVNRIDLEPRLERLGVYMDENEVVIPFYGALYRISASGIRDPFDRQPAHAVSVLLFRYLILCPDTPPSADNWVSYKDFKDAAPFVGGFVNTAERPIARDFSGQLGALEQACKAIGGRDPGRELSYDLAMRLDPLPRVPMLLLFNDRDEEFPAQCSLLFERRAEEYLDMECLAMAGMALPEYLKQAPVMF